SSCLVVALPFRSLPFRLVFRIWDLGVAWVYGILPFKGGAPKGRRVRAAEHNILHEPEKSVVLGRAHPRRFATVPWEGTHKRCGADIQTVSKREDGRAGLTLVFLAHYQIPFQSPELSPSLPSVSS